VKRARAYLGSLWRVDDDAAEAFALAFYQSVLQGHMIGEAVQHARIAVIGKHGEGQHAWASYVLYGPPWMRLPWEAPCGLGGCLVSSISITLWCSRGA
jgi:hypothetical protein